MQKRSATHVDKYVGELVRIRRAILGISQTELGEAMDLSSQQIQKYEKGESRISAGRLFALSEALGVPITYFFGSEDHHSFASGFEPGTHSMRTLELTQLTQAYARIKNPNLRKSVLKFIETFPAGDNTQDNG